MTRTLLTTVKGLLALGLFVGGQSAAHAGAEPKVAIAIVDNDRIESEYNEFKQKRQELFDLGNQKKNELQAREFMTTEEWDQLEALLAKQKKGTKLTPKEEEDKKKILAEGEKRRKRSVDLGGKADRTEEENQELNNLLRLQKRNGPQLELLLEEYGKQIDDLQRKALDELFEKVKKAIGEVAKQKGFTVVLLKQSVLWHDPTVEVTSEVLSKLNASPDKK